jgi:antitoxin component of RelBE/YafQ-DinJ toxin-antitoxin module
MKNIITSFVFFSLLGFYSNSIATMIMISNSTDYSVIPMDVISKFINENLNSTVKQERKAGKKVAKTQTKIDKLNNKFNPSALPLADLDLNDKKLKKYTKKSTKLENRMVALLYGVQFQFDDGPTPSGPTPSGPTPGGSTTGGSIASAPAPIAPIANDLFDGDSQSESVPEPSTIALLGLGLAGLGVARRFKKTA